jgi:hypothetical protein
VDALAAIETHSGEPLPLGTADRLARAGRELACARGRIYEHLALVEHRSVWPHRWQQIFGLLEGLGSTVALTDVELPGAPEGTDLSLLQSLLRSKSTVKSAGVAGAVRGDGSLVLVRGETPTELGELTAALLRAASPASDTLVVRCLDAAPLEAALERHGVPQQGHDSSSMWRPATQILPLALELAFEPRDCRRWSPSAEI